MGPMRLRLYHHPDDTRIAYREVGTGPPLALLSALLKGGGGDARAQLDRDESTTPFRRGVAIAPGPQVRLESTLRSCGSPRS
jgi:hypothetical protein